MKPQKRSPRAKAASVSQSVPPLKTTVATRRGKTITLHSVKHALTFSQRAKGLMGVKKEVLNYALVFHLEEKGRMNASIHMLFMKTPIDVLWLDENHKVVDWVEHAKPWALNYSPKTAAKFIVELPPHTLSKLKLKISEKVEW